MAHYIPLFPFIAFLINIFFGRQLKSKSALVSVLASGLSMLVAIAVFIQYLNGQGNSYKLGNWLTLYGVPLNFGVIVDGLSTVMLVMVTIVATLIKVYSIGYMHDDPRFSRYFAYISLFTCSMLGLIISDNLLLTYIFWEGVGVCSYLLISFWFEKPSAAKAGIKAFITTRIGDTAFLIGILLIFFVAKAFYFSDMPSITGHDELMTIAAILIFLGAVGKSAQFPLHVWLPDAMEGPTAVSALIHAATMVAAGVYLVARSYALFLAYPVSLEIVAWIGAISALMAATIATVNNDIKRILAYSTISQLGLMMLGLGVGGFSAGTFHLITHAFFKALLFLCAGSVIHSVKTQDIWKMGGLLGPMKVTGTTFIIGTLALAGVPPFSGFWSKDEILTEVYHHSQPLFIIAVIASFLTAFYMSRLIFVVLFGKSRSHDAHPHESPKTMTVPLIVLSVFAIFTGLLGSPLTHHFFQNIVYFSDRGGPVEIEMNTFIMGLSTVISLSGIGLAYVFYILGNKILPESFRSQFKWLHQLLLNKYYIDEIYDAVFVRPLLRICSAFSKFDFSVVDGMVNGVAALVQGMSSLLKKMQTGLVQNYLLVQVLGILLFILTLLGKLCFRF